MTSAHHVHDARIFHKISKSLARRGYEVILIARHQKDESIDGVHVAAVPKSGGRFPRMTINLYRIYKKALQLDGDIYHFHDPELLPLGLLLKLRGKHVVYDAHEDMPRTFGYKHYIPRSLRGMVACTAERFELFGARRLTAVIGATPPIADRFRAVNANTVVVHNFPIHDEISSCGLPWKERDRAVAYIGGISRERGIFELLQAIALVSPRVPCRFSIAGWFSPPELRDEVLKQAGSANIDFLGMLSRVQVAELLSKMRVGIVVLHPEPNFVNSKPTKLFEYMCAGIPVIASNFPMWTEIVKSAGCGLLVDPLKPAEMAEAIAYLLTHPREAEEMGRRGREAAERLFNWKTEETTLIRLYRSILEPREVSYAEKIECA